MLHNESEEDRVFYLLSGYSYEMVRDRLYNQFTKDKVSPPFSYYAVTTSQTCFEKEVMERRNLILDWCKWTRNQMFDELKSRDEFKHS